jgi:hypothetical protein
MFIVGHRHYPYLSSLAPFLLPRVAKLHLIDDTIDEIKIDVEDRDELFGTVFRTARCGSIMVDSAHWLTFVAICAALGKSELYESTCG